VRECVRVREQRVGELVVVMVVVVGGGTAGVSLWRKLGIKIAWHGMTHKVGAAGIEDDLERLSRCAKRDLAIVLGVNSRGGVGEDAG